jgi:hypothetical protein
MYSVTYKYLLNERLDTNVLSVLIGNDECRQPFKASIFNTKIETGINKTIKKEEAKSNDRGLKAFAKNIGSYKFIGGEEIFQITPDYFRCRSDKGTFSKAQFIQNACLSEIKMIELDLSGTAKARYQDFSTCKVGKNNTNQSACCLLNFRLQRICRSRKHASFRRFIKRIL